MNPKKIKLESKKYYENNIMGEPLTENVPIDCFIKGAELILKENRKNYRKAVNKLQPLQKKLINLGLESEWMDIINSLRICADMNSIELKNSKTM